MLSLFFSPLTCLYPEVHEMVDHPCPIFGYFKKNLPQTGPQIEKLKSVGYLVFSLSKSSKLINATALVCHRIFLVCQLKIKLKNVHHLLLINVTFLYNYQDSA
jgi:hypothetical protein